MRNKKNKLTRVFSPLIKIFAFILIIKASFLGSFAFVGDDLGLDLYKNIDSGIGELNSQMYSHELKGGKVDGDITQNFNNKIKSAGYTNCELSNLTKEDVNEIAFGKGDNPEKSGNLGLLSEKLNKECIKKVETLNDIQNIIQNNAIKSSQTAKSKSDDIYYISKQGLFSDGNIQNSPFDIVKDIKDIDYIIFTQEIEYEGDENVGDELIKKYLNGDKKGNGENNGGTGGDGDGNNEGDGDNGGDGGDGNNQEENGNGEKSGSGSDNQNSGNNGDDKTKIICPEDLNQSGLDQKEIEKINKNKNRNINRNINQNYKENNDLLKNPFTFSTSSNNSTGGNANSNIEKKVYQAVNDNEFFGGCRSFFCIEIEYLTYKTNLLIGGKTRSIQSIMERSNKHLKKFANSSLIQSKMTTNNFELGLRDLNLPDIFSMPVVIIKRTPPILDLDYFNKKVAKEKSKDNPNPFSWQNLLKSRFESLGIDYKRENDLSIFEGSDYNRKTTINNSELSISQAKINTEERNKRINEIKELDSHINKIINSNYQAKETDGMYKEFLELEKFSAEIQHYADALDKAGGKMLEIPIHP